MFVFVNVVTLYLLQNVSPQNAFKQQMDKVLGEANQELVNITRRDQPSVLRDRTYGGLTQDNWMIQIVKELTTRCPTIAEILSRLLNCSLSNLGKKLPPISLSHDANIFGVLSVLVRASLEINIFS